MTKKQPLIFTLQRYGQQKDFDIVQDQSESKNFVWISKILFTEYNYFMTKQRLKAKRILLILAISTKFY